MKDKFDTFSSSTFNHSDMEQEDFFNATNLNEIENDICHLQTLSLNEHRTIARRVYTKINDRISSIKDSDEKKELERLASLLNMKVKFI